MIAFDIIYYLRYSDIIIITRFRAFIAAAIIDDDITMRCLYYFFSFSSAFFATLATSYYAFFFDYAFIITMILLRLFSPLRWLLLFHYWHFRCLFSPFTLLLLIIDIDIFDIISITLIYIFELCWCRALYYYYYMMRYFRAITLFSLSADYYYYAAAYIHFRAFELWSSFRLLRLCHYCHFFFFFDITLFIERHYHCHIIAEMLERHYFSLRCEFYFDITPLMLMIIVSFSLTLTPPLLWCYAIHFYDYYYFHYCFIITIFEVTPRHYIMSFSSSLFAYMLIFHYYAIFIITLLLLPYYYYFSLHYYCRWLGERQDIAAEMFSITWYAYFLLILFSVERWLFSLLRWCWYYFRFIDTTIDFHTPLLTLIITPLIFFIE